MLSISKRDGMTVLVVPGEAYVPGMWYTFTREEYYEEL